MVKKLSFGLWSRRFKIEAGLLSYQSAYGDNMLVNMAHIDLATIEPARKKGWATLKVIGAGTTLGKVELPAPWARKAAMFITANLPAKATV